MSGVKRLEHATLRVTDLEAAVSFYTDVLGLVELEHQGDTVYLGCGLDENYDIGLIEGKTGLDHFAIRVDDPATVDAFADRLQNEDITIERTGGVEPNQETGVRFSLPTGVDMEFVTVGDTDYHHPTDTVGNRGAIAPLDVDHVNIMSWDVDRDTAFLTEHAGFTVSDEIQGESGFRIQAWLRHGQFHHDVGISTADNVVNTLHHLSFEVDSIEHIKRLCDRLTEYGHQLELGPSRHNAGANNFAYLWTPGGNRIEFTAEMATVDAGASKGVREINREKNTVSSWGGVEPTPEFLEQGS